MIDLLRARGYQSFLVICHDGDATTVFDSSLHTAHADSWGNLFFFKSPELHQQIVRHPDWGFVLEVSAECDVLRRQLRAKERIIRELEGTALDRLRGMEQLQAVAAERLQLIEQLHQALKCVAEPPTNLVRTVKRFIGRCKNALGWNDAA
jgi:hypothetical protein